MARKALRLALLVVWFIFKLEVWFYIRRMTLRNWWWHNRYGKLLAEATR